MLVRRSNQVRYKATDGGRWSFVGTNIRVMNESMETMIPSVMNAMFCNFVEKPEKFRAQLFKIPLTLMPD